MRGGVVGRFFSPWSYVRSLRMLHPIAIGYEHFWQLMVLFDESNSSIQKSFWVAGLWYQLQLQYIDHVPSFVRVKQHVCYCIPAYYTYYYVKECNMIYITVAVLWCLNQAWPTSISFKNYIFIISPICLDWHNLSMKMIISLCYNHQSLNF